MANINKPQANEKKDYGKVLTVRQKKNQTMESTEEIPLCKLSPFKITLDNKEIYQTS